MKTAQRSELEKIFTGLDGERVDVAVAIGERALCHQAVGDELPFEQRQARGDSHPDDRREPALTVRRRGHQNRAGPLRTRLAAAGIERQRGNQDHANARSRHRFRYLRHGIPPFPGPSSPPKNSTALEDFRWYPSACYLGPLSSSVTAISLGTAGRKRFLQSARSIFAN